MNPSGGFVEIGWVFPVLAVLSWILVPAYAAYSRGRLYAGFAGVILTFALPAALILHARLRASVSAETAGVLDVLFAYSMAAAGVQLVHLVRARMRGSAFRWLVSVPGQTFIAAGLIAGPWLLLLLPFRLLFQFLDWGALLGFWTLIEALPLPIAAASILTSVTARAETVRFPLSPRPAPGELANGSSTGPAAFRRVSVERIWGKPPSAPARRPLRIVQLTDTHLGPWQSVDRLRRRIADLVERQPDLVALTGDFLTMESMGTPGCLTEALAPLRPIADRCVAIFGNHDHEAPEHVRDSMEKIGIRLLVGAEACFESPVGRVQFVGADFVGSRHAEYLSRLLEEYPRRQEHLRILLLHDPIGFHALPENDVDLVLSGHTHGGQVGLVSLGFDWTALSASRWPDQGLFEKGTSRLYVHRGTGFYGFPLRIGVPAEHSVLEISLA